MRSRMGGLRESFKADKLRAVSGISKKIDSALEDNIIEWTTLFRRNWDIFAEFYLGIPLKPYQRQVVYCPCLGTHQCPVFIKRMPVSSATHCYVLSFYKCDIFTVSLGIMVQWVLDAITSRLCIVLMAMRFSLLPYGIPQTFD